MDSNIIDQFASVDHGFDKTKAREIKDMCKDWGQGVTKDLQV